MSKGFSYIEEKYTGNDVYKLKDFNTSVNMSAKLFFF